jgi:hypothetical protein
LSRTEHTAAAVARLARIGVRGWERTGLRVAMGVLVEDGRRRGDDGGPVNRT